MKSKKIKCLPCPCCGNKKLYIGQTMAAVMGVECLSALGGCGLSINRDYPDRMPRGVFGLDYGTDVGWYLKF
jgi:hypothetical protein